MPNGDMELTRIPCWHRSAARDLLVPISASTSQRRFKCVERSESYVDSLTFQHVPRGIG
ncbi:hypothetical protein RchiOBHm_Chr5g0073021 [Rosa chinensis]|uniref:Uncharacterized protein n=1 Tax=Rosa chinensis TaxID=74649 RepID=A0A2P6QKU5_ROSCH|nr:hypothetical protein RchiOBHm_Chr5g0073021 [Rosa chinensis]